MTLPGLRRVAVAFTATVVMVGLALGAGGCARQAPHDLDPAAVAIAGVAATPPMGWDSWNTFGCDIDEARIHAQADALVESGLAAAGYRYVVVDDCWYSPTRDADGRLVASPQRFPSGMAALGAYLHARGLLFGLYSGASDRMCAQLSSSYPGATGSRGHETTDARTFAAWGVDYIKYDWCSTNGDVSAQRTSFLAMRDAIRATGRPMVYSINPNSGVAVDRSAPGATHDWGGVATMTRLTNDITPAWTTGTGPAGYQGVRDIAAASARAAARVGSGRWLDLDMLEIGVGQALTTAEQRSHLALWAMSAAPLMAGNDLTRMGTATRDLLANPGILAVDQDRTEPTPRIVTADGWTRSRRMADGSVVVSVTDPTATGRSVTLDRRAVGAGDGAAVDVWTGRPIASTGAPIILTVAPGDTAVIRIG